MMTDKVKFLVMAILVFLFLFYSFFLYADLPAQENYSDKQNDTGKMTWQKYNCNACHQIYGLGGYLGPDITNVYSTKGLAYIQAFLKNGTNIMPDFHLTEHEINDLTVFLKNTDVTGKSDPKTFTIYHDGTIEQR